MRDLLTRKATQGPLAVQLTALRHTYDQIPADQQATFLARLDELCRAWTDYTPALRPRPAEHTRPAEGAFRPDSTLNRPRRGAHAWRP